VLISLGTNVCSSIVAVCISCTPVVIIISAYSTRMVMRVVPLFFFVFFSRLVGEGLLGGGHF